MKTTDHFKRTIETYLAERAYTDALFAVSYKSPDKNITDCITYILNCVKQSGCCGYTDDEIYSLAVHYYDEETIEVGKPINCNVIVNHTVELTPEEKEEARQIALKRVENETYTRLTKARKQSTVQSKLVFQKSLFDV